MRNDLGPTAGRLSSLEVCAGAGGLALGLEEAGFQSVALLDSKADACETLRRNRSEWTVLQEDFTDFVPEERPEISPPEAPIGVLAAGLPRLTSPATVMRPQTDHELFLLKATVWLAQALMPGSLLVENIPGLVTSESYGPVRRWVDEELDKVGYRVAWGVLDANDFGVPQHRPHGFMVALPKASFDVFAWPNPADSPKLGVGHVLYESMSSKGWPGAADWSRRACEAAPTIVGGSDKRGGADLGPSGSKRAWARLGINGGSVADEVPGSDQAADHEPKLTVPQVARLQGFPAEWQIAGRKTSAYRQVGNACPPALATAVGKAVAQAVRVSL